MMVGLHVMPGYPAGTIALRPGAIMANVASVFIDIKGKSSHGAMPHQGIDAIYASSLAIIQFQSLISRFKDPNEKAVLSIGKITGGVRLNVIAQDVHMEGTVRSFSFETENRIEEGMSKILKGLEHSMGITYDFKFKRAAKFVKNDPRLTAIGLPIFKKILGEQHVIITDPVTIGEDFAEYSHRVPSLFFFLGAGREGRLHTPQFSVDEKMFYYGPTLLASAAIQFMREKE